MKEKALPGLTFQLIHPLLVGSGSQGGHHQRLGLSAGEHGRSVSPGEEARITGDLANIVETATVDPDLLLENAAPQVLLLDLPDEVGALGTGTDDAHITVEDVDELRQLVEARLSKELANRGDPRITSHRPQGLVAFRVHDHRPYLINPPCYFLPLAASCSFLAFFSLAAA